ncbi:MAG: hypothetical protein AMS15_02930 [Planctomycetes bacterium DG_23]|nr:MAG: hypothetical protein AMS15_02930 [Planctomycetes bacterium DG_23]
MAWTLVPVSIGDEIKAAQLSEVRSALMERQQVAGGTPPPTVNAGDALLGSVINEYRGRINGIIPDFIDETTGNYWTKAALFESLYGSGRSDWLRRPSRAPGGELEGYLLTGDICYIEHINEMYDVLNELAWVKVFADDYLDENEHTLLQKSGMSGPQATRSDAVDEFWSSLQDSIIISRPLITPWLYAHTRYQQGTDPYGMDGDLRRSFAVVSIPTYPFDIVDARALVEISSYYEDAIDGDIPFNSYSARLFGSTTSPGTLNDGDWNFGAEVASVGVTDLGGTEIIDFDHSALEQGANFFIQQQGKNTRPDRLKTANWYKPPETFHSADAVSHFVVEELFLKLGFQYQ